MVSLIEDANNSKSADHFDDLVDLNEIEIDCDLQEDDADIAETKNLHTL